MKKIISFTFLTLVFVLCFSGCDENEFDIFSTLHGVVVDDLSGECIPNATITLSPGGKTQTSGTDGRYEFQNIDAQQYTVTVQKPGYSTNRKIVNVVSGEATEANVTLRKIQANE